MKAPNISKDALFHKLDYTPHSALQWECHNSTARFRIACCGRRWGKTHWAGREFSYYMFIPDSYWWIVAPKYTLGEKEFRIVYRDLEKMGILAHPDCRKSYNVNQGVMSISTPWNSVLEVKSAERKDSLLGEGLDGVIMSEAARHSLETWEQYIEPALSDKRGIALFPSTPRGFNWFQGLWELGQHSDKFPDYESWRLPSWTNTVVFPGGYDDPELVRIRSRVSKPYWDQEYAAEFTSFEGQIYPDFNVKHHVKEIKYVPSWRNYWAMDFGYTDPFCCYDIMVDPSDNVYVWREYQVRHLSTWEHGLHLKNRENPDGFHVDAIFADPRGADEIATLALVLGPISARPVGWQLGVEAIRRHLKLQPDGNPKLFIDPSCIHLIRQMQALRAKEAKEGHNAKEGQHDYDDHGPDALRYFFSEFFVLGAGSSLGDIYDRAYFGSEAETFFTQHTQITLDDRIGYGPS